MTSFKEYVGLQEIEAFITSSTLTFVYIGKPNCSVCDSLLPQIKTVMKNYSTVKTAYVDTEKTILRQVALVRNFSQHIFTCLSRIKVAVRLL